MLLGSKRKTGQSDDQGRSGVADGTDTGQPTLLTYNVIRELKHDSKAFTQGFEFDKKCEGDSCQDIFWESTGLNGRSSVREVDLETGEVLKKVNLMQSDFGEGITRLGNKLYQLTWRSPKIITYSVANLEDVKTGKVLYPPHLERWRTCLNI